MNPPIKVYVAASWKRRDEARHVSEALRAEGYIVTARWPYPEADTWLPSTAAGFDLADIDAADGLLSLTSGPEVGYQTGSRHIEFGYALARGKWLWLVGSRENVFHQGIGKVIAFPTLAAWLDYMKAPTVRMVLPQAVPVGAGSSAGTSRQGPAPPR